MKEENKIVIDYSNHLVNMVKTSLSLNSVPLKIVIELLSDKKVIRFDESDIQHQFVLDKLKELASETRKIILSEKASFIETKGKAHDLGHQMTLIFLQAMLNKKMTGKGLDENDPFKMEFVEKNLNGKYNENTLDYPQFCFSYKNLHSYITLKTHGLSKTKSSEQNFNLSQIKTVTEDALHFVISFNVFRTDKDYFDWKIVEIANVFAEIKREFLFDNSEIYREENILDEGY